MIIIFSNYEVGTQDLDKNTIEFQYFIKRLFKEASDLKLENYMKKVELKKLKLLDKSIVFLDSYINEISKLQAKDLSYSISQKNDESELKARIFAFIYIKLSNLTNFKPFSVNKDLEEEKGWNIYVVLLHNIDTNNDSNNQLIKICLPEEKGSSYGLIVKFDNTCKEKIDLLNKNHFFEKHEFAKQIRVMEDKITNSNIKNKFKQTDKLATTNNNINTQDNINSTKNQQLPTKATVHKSSSFIENSANEKLQTFSMESLANKFTMDELYKIKSLIKFGKVNKLIDRIYKTNGNVKLEDLILNSEQTAKAKNINDNLNNRNYELQLIGFQHSLDLINSKVNKIESVIDKLDKKLNENDSLDMNSQSSSYLGNNNNNNNSDNVNNNVANSSNNEPIKTNSDNTISNNSNKKTDSNSTENQSNTLINTQNTSHSSASPNQPKQTPASSNPIINSRFLQKSNNKKSNSNKKKTVTNTNRLLMAATELDSFDEDEEIINSSTKTFKKTFSPRVAQDNDDDEENS